MNSFTFVIRNTTFMTQLFSKNELWKEFSKWQSIFGVIHGDIKKTDPSNDSRKWHFFSHNHSPCVRGAKAEAEYIKLSTGNFIVFIHGTLISAVKFQGALPDICGIRKEINDSAIPLDIYISSVDYDWTFVVTHEDHTGIGPFFSLKTWQKESDD